MFLKIFKGTLTYTQKKKKKKKNNIGQHIYAYALIRVPIGMCTTSQEPTGGNFIYYTPLRHVKFWSSVFTS